MANFQTVNHPKVQKSRHDLSHDLKTTLNMGNIVPILYEEVLPGDIFKVSAEIFMRMMPLSAPAMHRVDVYTHFFFVPNRLVWDSWNEFITLGEDGLSTPEHPYTTYDALNPQVGSLADYLGIPTNMNMQGHHLKISALPFRAYSLIYNEFYRDQNLQDELAVSTADGMDDDTNITLQRRSWRHDYFTSCLPFAQKGSPVQIPLGEKADVKLIDRPVAGFPEQWLLGQHSSTHLDVGAVKMGVSGANKGYLLDTDNSQFVLDPNGTFYADLTEATATTVNDLRLAFQLQRFLERNARGGSRYIESLYSHFGVISSDARLQRPEYLGGGQAPVVISEVLQTSETANTPIGTMGGRGVAVGRSNRFTRRFEEHGMILGLMTVMPKTSYMQGLPRKFSRFEALDYAFPVFAHLGEQEVLNKEIYIDGTEQDDAVFGYQERYAEYRDEPDRVAGEFRATSQGGTLSYWHIGRIFGNRPQLNASFIECNPRNDIFAVTDEGTHHLISQIFFKISAVRPLPKDGQPGYIDHF